MENLFQVAVKNDDILNFLIGYEDYEIRFNIAYMPTDVSAATRMIALSIKNNPDNYSIKIINAFIELSRSSEWSWLIVYYVPCFLKENLDFLPLETLYENLQNNKQYLLNNSGWLCFNFKPKYNNLWEIILNENNRQRTKFDIPILK